ncbi:MAG: hypothetical protein D6820_00110 [Lentisphaerae bacterium]|nr:MAG: hypothetical protein D6820_00110 [Lentisphaerota bacterium]
MRSGMSQYVEVEATENEDGETAEVTVQADDLVLVNFEVVSGDEDIDVEDLPPKDKRLLKQRNNWIYLGENEYLPGLNKQLIGCKLNDAKDVVIEFPEDFAVEPLRGKKLTYEFEIQRVRRLQLPELDDEFAKTQNCESMEELRDRVRQQLEEQINNQYEQDLNQAIIDKIVENVPEFKIGANTLRDARERVTPRLRSQNPKKEDEDNAAYEERLNALIEEEAVKEAREWIVIQNIINKNKIQPDFEKFYEYHQILSQYQELINARQGGGRSPMHDQRLQSQALQGAMLHALYRFLRQQMGLETEEETEQAAEEGEEKTDEEQEQSEQSE